MKVPPDPIRNYNNSLVYFMMPKSYLDKKSKIFLMMSSEAKPSKYRMPSYLAAYTDVLDQDLKFILQ